MHNSRLNLRYQHTNTLLPFVDPLTKSVTNYPNNIPTLRLHNVLLSAGIFNYIHQTFNYKNQHNAPLNMLNSCALAHN